VQLGEAVISDVLTSLWVVVGHQSTNFTPPVAVLDTKLASEPALEFFNALMVEPVLLQVPAQ
jgi:hypothetical protein